MVIKPRRLLASGPSGVHVRPRIQRAFFKWLAQNHRRMALEIQIDGRTDRRVDFSFIGINKGITGWLTTYEIEIVVWWNGEVWDMPVSIWCAATRVNGGYLDKSVIEKYRHLYRSREDLWVGELFEPFVGIVNGTIATSAGVSICQSKSGGTTWARFEKNAPGQELGERQDETGMVAFLPCREA